MKMYCKIKRPDNAKGNINSGEDIVIQEKIDGSNTAIFNDNGKMRLFSRTQELKGDNGLGDFVKYARKKEIQIMEHLPNGYVIFGEWLAQGKISYNSLAKQEKIEPYYVFDIASNVNPELQEGDVSKIQFVDIDTMKNIAESIGLKTVPELARTKLESFEELKKAYVDNQKSALEGTDCIREGIVIKTLDGKKRLKIVADKFQEVKSIKNSTTKNEFDFLDKYITPMRITKFLTAIGVDDPTPEIYGTIFKKLDIISDDIIEEEGEQILKDIGKIIKKRAVINIKQYVEDLRKDENYG